MSSTPGQATEIAVATTKAYSTQLVLLDMLGVYFAKVCGSIGDAEYEEIVEGFLPCLSRWRPCSRISTR